MNRQHALLVCVFLMFTSSLFSQQGTTLQKFNFDNATDQLILDEHMRALKLYDPFVIDFWSCASQLNTTLGKHTLFFHEKGSGNANCDVSGNNGGYAKGLWAGYVFENNVWYFRIYKPTWNRYDRCYFIFTANTQVISIRINEFDEASEIVGKWAHWAISYNQTTGQLNIYFNGIKKDGVKLSATEWFLWAGDCVHNGFWKDMFLAPNEQYAVTRGYDVYNQIDNGKLLFGSLGQKDNPNSSFAANRYPFTGSIAQIRLRQIDYSAATFNDYDKVTDYTKPEYFYYLRFSNDYVGHAVYNTNVAVQAANDLPVHPMEVTNLTATVSCNAITLNWNLVDATSAGVWRTPDDAFFYVNNSKTFTDNPPRPDIDYTYTVKGLWNVSIASVGTNYFSKEGVTVTARRGDPGPPDTFTATPDCDGTIKLDWSRKAVATGYQIEIGDQTTFSNGTQTIVPLGNVFTYTHAPNVPDKAYIYKIISQNSLNCGRNTTNFREATATTKTTCSTAPTNVQAVVSGDAINISWTYVHSSGSAPNRFAILRRTGETGDFVSIGTATGNTIRTYSDLSGASCVNYYYKVQALAPCGGTTLSISTASTVAKKIAPFTNVFLTSSGAYFSGSKGYFGDKVELEWKVNPNKIGDVTQFQIFRKESASSALTLIKTLEGSTYSTWNDASVEANKVYTYQLRAVADCEGTPTYSDTITTTGFRIKTGFVSGKITFEGGNAVENVEVRSSRGTSPTSCLDFSTAVGCAYKTYTTTLRPDTALSVEAWVYSSEWNSVNGVQMILDMDYTSNMYFLGNRVVCGVSTSDDRECKIDYGYNFSETTGWHHFAYTFGGGKLTLYIDGKKRTTVNANTTVKTLKFLPNLLVTIGSQTATNTLPFKGKLDEFRIWKRCKTEEEIGFDYVRNMSADESGLMGYWRMDENTGNYLYDCSKQDGVYNKNHLLFAGAPKWSTLTPSYEQLHPSGLTDKYGNYKVTNIAYTGTGEIFSITPIKGIHRFDPTDRTLFIGDNSPVQNNIDFTDKSSFVFRGKVFYKNTNFPVKKASVYIDNALVVGDGKEPVTTNDFGEFSINVPIGNHYVSVKKDGHIFEFNGQWPQPTTNEPYSKFNFQDDIAQIMTFYDITRVKVAGRFVGGNVEGNKKLGFHKSINNIGVGTIQLGNASSYDIDTTAAGSKDKISFTTDVNSGEYFIQLLPEKYNILSVSNSRYIMKTEGLGILDLTTIPSLTTVSDTVFLEDNQGNQTNNIDKIQTKSYHYARNFIYYAQPTLRVYSQGDYPLIGEDTIRVTNPVTKLETTLHLNDVSSPFRYPVFRMGARYPINIFVYEEYENANKLDQVPVANAEVTINNAIEVNAPIKVFKTDEHGFLSDYTLFQVGVPNMSTDLPHISSYTKTLSITAKTTGYQITWPTSGVYRGYVLGSVDAAGANFVSYGPQMPAIVLHDPPGSNSYAYLKKGSEYMVKQSCNFSQETNTKYDNTISIGYNFQIGGGLAGPVFENRFINDMKLGLAVQSFASNDGGYMEKWTFNEDFKTSDAADAVGSMADVFIGQSQNYYFSETKNLQILPTAFCVSSGLESLSTTELASANAGFTLGIRDGFAATPETEKTLFVYTQDHIINKLIPELIKLRNNLLADNTKYKSKVPASHVNYGLPNKHPAWKAMGDSSALPSYTFTPTVAGEMDSLEFLHQQIAIWVQTIATNEAAKANATYDDNVSFDGLSGAYQREANIVSTIYDGKRYKKSFKVFGGSNSGFNTNGIGVYMTSESSMNFEQQIATNEEDTKTMTWGFVLDDSDQGDYYSVGIASNEYLKPMNVADFTTDNRKMNDKVELLNSLTGGVSATGGTGMVLKKMYDLYNGKVVPGYIGSVVAMALTSTLQAISMGVFGNFISDIENKGHDAVYSAVTHSPIFKILGGQSRCPYEGPEYSIFYSNTPGSEPAIIHIGTQQQEKPEIAIEPGERVNVPESSKAEFTLKLKNASPTNKDLTYYLKVDEAANSDGAILTIDGINPNFRQFFIPAGQTLTKTLTVEKGSNGIMDYNNLGLIIHSACQFNPEDNLPDIADTVKFSVYFLPTCTNVDLYPQENWVVNTSDKDTMTVILSGYDLNSSNFEKIVFQYRSPGGPIITPITFVKNATDTVLIQGPKELINNRSGITWMFPMENLNDGTYEIRAKTICKGGYEFVTPWYSGILDGMQPKQFGEPQPAGGILWTGSELSLQFNEALNVGYLNAHKELISVRGVLNNTDLSNFKYIQHDASLHFDGIQQHMVVSDGVNLKYTSFTIEFWAKRERTGKECLISQEEPLSGGLWIGFDENNRFTMILNGQTVKTDKSYSHLINQWSHFACVFNNGSDSDEKGITLIVAADAGTEEVYRKVDYGYFATGPFYAGYCHDDGTAFKGNMHDLRVWTHYRLLTDISSGMYILHSGYEKGLCSLWPMDDASGPKARDIAFSRNGVVNATWQVSRGGKAIALNGGYLSFGTEGMAFDNESDFTLEYWFKGTAASDTVFLFSGDLLNPSGWGVGATSEGKLFVRNGLKTIKAGNTNYLDNNWHHFALCMNRRNNISIYMDGLLTQTVSASGFNGFGSDKCIIGARYTAPSSGDRMDHRFTGVVDEIRLWNMSKQKSQIVRYMQHSLTGDEVGLTAYFPFEDVTISDPSLTAQTLRNMTSDTTGVAGNSITFGLCGYTDETPSIKLHLPVTDIAFDYVVNGDKIIITPIIEENKIEHTNLEISVQGVKDVNNNTMSSAVTWSAFVNRNQLFWGAQKVSYEITISEPLSFTQQIANLGGVTKEWEIYNLPPWLSANITSGTIDALRTEDITFTLNPAINVGEYSHDIYVSSSEGSPERLVINLMVKGIEPDWSVDNEKFEHSMSLVGKIKIGEHLCTNVNDKVWVFSGNECRGSGYQEYIKELDTYVLFLDIFGTTNGDTLTFKIWDACDAKVYTDAQPILTFIKNEVLGTINDPVIIFSNGEISRDLSVKDGWKWLSFNLETAKLHSTNALMQGVPAREGDAIKGLSLYDLYSEGLGWMGGLTNGGGIKKDKMYMFHMSQVGIIHYSGLPIGVSSVPITLLNGWNWIGYTPQVKIPINEALAYLTPEQDDVIKSQYDFALFDKSIGWYGCLNYMEPGVGYKYKAKIAGSVGSKTFIYPSESMLRSLIVNEALIIKDFTPEAWMNSMSLVAQLKCKDRTNYTDFILLAYNKGKLVGAAKAADIVADTGPLYFMTLYGNEPVESLSFKLAKVDNQLITASTDVNELIKFTPDTLLGTMNQPVVLTLLESALVADPIICYPNPFSESVTILLNTNEKASSIEICDLLGKTIETISPVNNRAVWGRNSKESNTPAGLYLVKIRTENGGMYYKKMIKQ